MDLIKITRIPGGSFLMGSEIYEYESPKHEVTVPTFFMGIYPVTQAQYKTVMGHNPATRYDVENFVSPNKPVVGVSWHDAQVFCQRLTEYSGKNYRLPSEAEWEYACRAGTTTPFYFGETITSELANYNAAINSYNGSPRGEYRRTTTCVGQVGVANAFGLYDMHGNVYDWCQDTWHDSYDGAPADGSAWTNTDSQTYTKSSENKVIRGGSWMSAPSLCEANYRSYEWSAEESAFIGFRVACDYISPFQAFGF
jgi:formylglycine-generating enzyme required for sulfatase activity